MRRHGKATSEKDDELEWPSRVGRRPLLMRLTESWDQLAPYSSPIKRRGRKLSRYARNSFRSGLLPCASWVPTYWWDQDRNFGDQLTPTLLPRLGVLPVHQPPRHSALIGVGSIIEHLPMDYRGTIWGSGLMFDRSIRLPEATIVAVRGRLSAEHLGLGDTVATGDPGLLLRGSAPHCTGGIALVPHFRHRQDPLWDQLQAYFGPGVRRVDVRQSPRAVAQQIAKARMIVTSSLHGLITADAHGVPAAWTLPKPWGEGGAFKFLDYESNYGGSWERYAVPTGSMKSFGDAVLPVASEQVDRLCRGLTRAIVERTERYDWKMFTRSPMSPVNMHRHRRSFGSVGNQWPRQAESFAVVPREKRG